MRKKGATVTLAVMADQTKLSPYSSSKGIQFPKGLHVVVQENSWMEENLITDWIKKVWKRHPDGLLCHLILLVLVSFCGHLMQEVKDIL